MARGSKRPNRQILQELSALVIDDDVSLAQATELVSELATRQPWAVPRLQLGPSAWQDYITAEAPTGPMGGSWLRDFDAVMEIVFELYERDFGSTRRTLHMLNAQEPRIPYLRVFVQHALFDLEPDAPSSLHSRAQLEQRLRSLFGADARLLGWARRKLDAGVLLKALGGMTNTVIGMYDWLAEVPESGLARLPRDAEARFDLGGGFGTPDLARLLRCSLTSLDLHPPTHAKAVGIRRFQVADPPGAPTQVAQTRWQTDAEAATYFEALERQAFHHWDVFVDPIDAGAASYLVTSFGFLTSTVASHSRHALNRQQLGRNVLAQMHTTFTGIRRVLSLVALGKDVALFTYQRATSRCYRNVTLMLRFVRGRLVDSATLERPFQISGAGILGPSRRPP